MVSCGFMSFYLVEQDLLIAVHLQYCSLAGLVPNLRGRILSRESETTEVEPGLYVIGWLMRDPSGIVVTNLHCRPPGLRASLHLSPDCAAAKPGFTWQGYAFRNQGNGGFCSTIQVNSTTHAT